MFFSITIYVPELAFQKEQLHKAYSYHLNINDDYVDNWSAYLHYFCIVLIRFCSQTFYIILSTKLCVWAEGGGGGVTFTCPLFRAKSERMCTEHARNDRSSGTQKPQTGSGNLLGPPGGVVEGVGSHCGWGDRSA